MPLCSYLAARFERLLAFTAGETLLMICIAHRGHHLTLHVLVACGTLRTEVLLVVERTVVEAILREEPTGRQGFVTLRALEAGLMEVAIRYAQYLARTLLLALAALDFTLSYSLE